MSKPKKHLSGMPALQAAKAGSKKQGKRISIADMAPSDQPLHVAEKAINPKIYKDG